MEGGCEFPLQLLDSAEKQETRTQGQMDPQNSFTCWRNHSLSCKEMSLGDITAEKAH